LGAYRKVARGYRIVMSPMTSHDYDVIVVMSQLPQEAQLPQRKSASAAHMPTPLPLLATPMHMVESETRNKRTSSVP